MRLKDIAIINRSTLAETTDPDYRFAYVDISAVDGLGNITIPDELVSFGNAPSRARRIAPAGSTVVSTVRTYLRAIGKVPPWPDPLVFSTGFAVIEARPVVEPRFLSYFCQSTTFVDDVVARSTGVSYPAINASDLGSFSVSIPEIDEQRRIADFLDAETSRIDRIDRLQRQVHDLLMLRRNALVDEAFESPMRDQSVRVVPLKYVVRRVSVGIVIRPADWYVDAEGVPALRGLNVEPARVKTDDMVMISIEGHIENQKSRLNAGDLVVVRTGQAGAAAVVPKSLEGANCIDLVIIRPGNRLDPKYLEYLLNSGYARRQVDEHSVGSIQSHFNVGAMKQMPIPVPTLESQRHIVRHLDGVTDAIDRAASAIDCQLSLLSERRQALITAAVTGQIDVTTACGFAPSGGVV